MPALTIAQLRNQCRLQFDTSFVLLIERRWLEQEADRLGIRVDEAALRARVRAVQESQAEASPRSLPIIRQERRTEQLKSQIRDELSARYEEVTDADIERYRERYPRRFVRPATRQVRIVSAASAQQARQAMQALQSGHGWRRFATPLTIDADTATVADGRTTFSEDKGDEALLGAVFGATPGRAVVLATSSGRYVFIVDRVTPRSTSVAKARIKVRRLLAAKREMRIRRDFNARYIRKTTCSPGYVYQHCGNR